VASSHAIFTGYKRPRAVIHHNELVSLKRPFAACDKLPAVVPRRFERKECYKMTLDASAAHTRRFCLLIDNLVPRHGSS
jgi:hypothetical protein